MFNAIIYTKENRVVSSARTEILIILTCLYNYHGKKKKDNTGGQKDRPSKRPEGNEKMDKDANRSKKGREGPSRTWLGVRGEVAAHQKEDIQN